MLFTTAVRGSWTECKSDCDGLRHGGSSSESAPGIRLSGRCANPERPRSGNDGARAKRRKFVVGCPPGDGFRADVQQTRQLARESESPATTAIYARVGATEFAAAVSQLPDLRA
jgi:hypothetical protein